MNLATYLGGTPDAGGTWTAPGGGATGANLDPAVAVSGNYTYSVTSGSCTSSAVIAVTINQPPNAGADGVLAICSTSAPTDLGTIITGEQAGGTWTGPGNTPFSGSYDPAVNVPGTYTYTVAGIIPCANDQATVQVNETDTEPSQSFAHVVLPLFTVSVSPVASETMATACAEQPFTSTAVAV